MDTTIALSIKDILIGTLVILPSGFLLGQEYAYRKALRLTAMKEDRHVLSFGKHG